MFLTEGSNIYSQFSCLLSELYDGFYSILHRPPVKSFPSTPLSPSGYSGILLCALWITEEQESYRKGKEESNLYGQWYQSFKIQTAKCHAQSIQDLVATVEMEHLEEASKTNNKDSFVNCKERFCRWRLHCLKHRCPSSLHGTFLSSPHHNPSLSFCVPCPTPSPPQTRKSQEIC